MENKLFQIVSNVTICNNISAYYTSEGLYLSDDTKAMNLKSAEVDIKLIDDLLLTEMDYNKKNTLELIVNIYQTTNTKLCQLYKSFINLYSKIDDEFFVFSDFNGNDAVLYSDQGRIFIPQCVIIDEIQLINKTTLCYKDVPVIIKLQNKSINAFLTQERIIRMVSKQVSCVNNKQIIHVNSETQIIKTENTIKLEKELQFRTVKFNLQNNNITKINFMFNHDQIIINSLNLIKDIMNVTMVDAEKGDVYIIRDSQSENENTFSDLIKKLEDSKLSFSNMIHNTILYILCILNGIFISFLVIAVKRNHKERFRCRDDIFLKPGDLLQQQQHALTS